MRLGKWVEAYYNPDCYDGWTFVFTESPIEPEAKIYEAIWVSKDAAQGGYTEAIWEKGEPNEHLGKKVKWEDVPAEIKAKFEQIYESEL